MTCCEALDTVATALPQSGDRHFQIGLVGYFLDGRPHAADGLAVNAANTPSFVRSNTGFACEGFFPPAMLDADTVSTHPALHSTSGVEMIRVRIEVESRDVCAIAEFIDGRQHDLFVDPGVIITRKFAFAEEAADWRRRPATRNFLSHE